MFKFLRISICCLLLAACGEDEPEQDTDSSAVSGIMDGGLQNGEEASLSDDASADPATARCDGSSCVTDAAPLRLDAGDASLLDGASDADCSDGSCPECSADLDCPATSPFCKEGVCSACTQELCECGTGDCDAKRRAEYIGMRVCMAFARAGERAVPSDTIMACTSSLPLGRELGLYKLITANYVDAGIPFPEPEEFARCDEIASRGGRLVDCFLDGLGGMCSSQVNENGCPCFGLDEICVQGKCVMNRGGAVQQRVGAVGEACDKSRSCAPGLACSGDRCVSLPDVGGACSAQLPCVRGTCREGTCSNLAAGDPCSAERVLVGDLFDPCGDKLSCSQDSQTCVVEGAFGSACSRDRDCLAPNFVCRDGACGHRNCR